MLEYAGSTARNLLPCNFVRQMDLVFQKVFLASAVKLQNWLPYLGVSFMSPNVVDTKDFSQKLRFA